MTRTQIDYLVGLLVALFLVGMVFLLMGCAKTKLVAPQPAGVTSGISRVRAGVTRAQSQHSEIIKTNVAARSALEKADSKDAVIKAWRVWKKEHP